MTGWRVGFVFGNKNRIDQLASLISQSTSGVTTVSQWAAVAVLNQSKKMSEWVRKEMQKRRDVLIKALNTHFGIQITPPFSTLYVFISLSDLGVNNTLSVPFCMQLLEDANVACVPGAAFGKEGYIRLSFGACEEDLKLGVKALAQYVSECNHS
jgi:aspartate aminotransferase